MLCSGRSAHHSTSGAPRTPIASRTQARRGAATRKPRPRWPAWNSRRSARRPGVDSCLPSPHGPTGASWWRARTCACWRDDLRSSGYMRSTSTTTTTSSIRVGRARAAVLQYTCLYCGVSGFVRVRLRHFTCIHARKNAFPFDSPPLQLCTRAPLRAAGRHSATSVVHTPLRFFASLDVN